MPPIRAPYVPALSLALLAAFAFAPEAPAAPLSAASRPSDEPEAAFAGAVGDPLFPGVWRLAGAEPTLPPGDLAPLKTLIGRASLVGLGETVHTSGGFYKAKDRVIRYLVSQLGFRLVAWETPYLEAEKIEAYVQSCSGDTVEAQTHFFGVWASTEVGDLLQWMCGWNRAHPRKQDKVHFMGFDIQDGYGQLKADGAALRAFLVRVGLGLDDPVSTGLGACDGVERSEEVIPLERYQVCDASLSALEQLFARRAAELTRRTSKTDFAWAKLRLTGIRAWEDEIFYFTTDDARSYVARDQGMAYFLLNLRALRFPKAKTVVWAHNTHLGKGNSIVAPYDSNFRYMGWFLARSVGKDYVPIALASHETAADWPAARLCGPIAGIGRPGSIEALLHDLREGDLLLDLRQRAVVPGLIPDGPGLLGAYLLTVQKDFDLLLYLDRSPKMTPLRWPSCE